MLIDYDPAKDIVNQAKHGVSLATAGLLEWETVLISMDKRKDYGEDRFRAFGLLDDRLYLVVFTVRGQGLRAISMRKANQREVRRYEQA
ncbi:MULTISPECIES: BrnT family toxin [unclassified Cupriavidus]|uniref:BrnT family toxin n=1 Tax=unclassified Cupriavidus TaxID=2640874 RepID=UPI00313E79A5